MGCYVVDNWSGIFSRSHICFILSILPIISLLYLGYIIECFIRYSLLPYDVQ